MPADSYLMHIQPFFCSCGNSWTHSSLFHSQHIGAGTRLESVAEITATHERIGISTLQPRKVATCSLCVVDLATAHNARVDEQLRLWEEALARKKEEEEIAREALRPKATPRPSPKPSNAPTPDEL